MKLNFSTNRSKHRLCYLALLTALSSCSLLEQQSGPAPAVPSATATRAATVANAANQAAQPAALSIIAGQSADQQQALIDEINRDGQTAAIPGFREAVPQPVQVEGDNVVELNYEQVDLRLVLEELAQALDITIVIDPSIDNKVSIRTAADRPLSREDIWPLIRLLTRDAGVVLERAGNVYNARQIQSALPVEIATPDTLGQGTAARIMQITPLTYVSAAAAREVIAPLLAPEGEVRLLSTNNTLAISATESQLERINQLLLLIDADPFTNQGIHLYQLTNASAVEVAVELEEILLLIEGPSPSYQVRGIERINAILVTAPASRGFSEIARWVRILDAESQEQVEQLFHYQVKNLHALELAATLSEIFEEEDEGRLLAVNAGDGTAQAMPPGVAAAGELAVGSTNLASTAPAAVSANLSVKIVADEFTNSLLIRSTARDYRQLLTTINQLDVVPLQVMISAVIAQITLTDATKFGVDWSRVAANSAINDISTFSDTNFLPGGGLDGFLFTKTFLDGAARIDATLEAIAENNEVQLLARPTLTVVNNQEAEIQIGAQVPVEQGQSIGAGGVATTNIQYRDTGIVLSITPQINNDGIINLIIRQELSSVDNSAIGVNNNPVFNNQEINTTVVVRDGENVVLGGLIQTETQSLNTGIPGLNRIPWIGRLFSYRQESIERKELFIVLRPEIINLNEQSGIQYSDILNRFELASALLDRAGI